MKRQAGAAATRSASPSPPLLVAGALALAAAVSLGLARFSYALLLPPMRTDLGWSYLTAGSMNTVNAAGYLFGALLLPRVLARFDARSVLLAGGGVTAVLLVAHGAVLADAALLVLRFFSGVASAATFVAGGLLAARLGSAVLAAPGTPGTPGAAGGLEASNAGNTSSAAVACDAAKVPGPRTAASTATRNRSGLVLGIYYGGTGLGIVASALLVPPLAARATPHAWQGAWIGLGLAALLATLVTAALTRHLAQSRAAAVVHLPFDWKPFAFGLAGYFMFGLGYIGYMTFVITLLREQQMSGAQIVGFYVLLGLAVVASSWLWAGLLQRFRGGESLCLLNGLLALATLLPVLIPHPLAVFASGLLFGSVFLSLVASTTALVRHNLPPAAWPAGISAFTIVFAVGQIVGPSLVGWVADGPGGLARGFVGSALALALGAALAWLQKPLGQARVA